MSLISLQDHANVIESLDLHLASDGVVLTVEERSELQALRNWIALQRTKF